MVRGEWTVVGTKEVARDKSFYDYGKDEPRTRIEEVRGYTPDREKDVEVITEVLKQTVENIDLPQVIKAINGL